MIKDHSLLTTLCTEPQHFEFFHAVRLIIQIIKAKLPQGKMTRENTELDQIMSEHIRFCTTPSLGFPANMIDSVELIAAENKQLSQFVVQIPWLGLFGACGLLPNHYTELLLQCWQEKNHTVLDFLNLFNHRIAWLFYQAWQKNRWYVNYNRQMASENSADRFTYLLDCLTGCNSIKTRQPNSLLIKIIRFYAPFFANQHRPAWSLQSILNDYFAVPVTITPFQAKCFLLAAKDCTRLAITHFNQIGINTILGNCVWDDQHHFRVSLGPLDYEQFKRFLPGRNDRTLLATLIQEYVGNHSSFDIDLTLSPEHIPNCVLGAMTANTLGESIWLN